MNFFTCPDLRLSHIRPNLGAKSAAVSADRTWSDVPVSRKIFRRQKTNVDGVGADFGELKLAWYWYTMQELLLTFFAVDVIEEVDRIFDDTIAYITVISVKRK